MSMAWVNELVCEAVQLLQENGKNVMPNHVCPWHLGMGEEGRNTQVHLHGAVLQPCSQTNREGMPQAQCGALCHMEVNEEELQKCPCGRGVVWGSGANMQ